MSAIPAVPARPTVVIRRDDESLNWGVFQFRPFNPNPDVEGSRSFKPFGRDLTQHILSLLDQGTLRAYGEASTVRAERGEEVANTLRATFTPINAWNTLTYRIRQGGKATWRDVKKLQELMNICKLDKVWFFETLKDIKHLDAFDSDISDADLENVVSQMSNLRTLNLKACISLTDAGLAHLRTLPLTTLNLSHCYKLTNAGVAHLSNLHSLTTLNLLCCSHITDVGVACLSTLPLTTLNLSYCDKLTDVGADHLSNLHRLTTLDLTGCKLTDAGLAHLSALPLTMLGLSYCDNLTDAGVARFSRDFPNLRIVR